MPPKAILYILAAMILWDFSLHIYDLLHTFKKTKAKHPFGAYLIYDYFGGKNEQKRQKVRQIFWTAYWGTASTLILYYIFS